MLSMSSADEIRRAHFKQFMSLSAEEQLAWAISHGYEMLSLLPEDAKATLEKLRNGAKRHRPSIQSGHKGA